MIKKITCWLFGFMQTVWSPASGFLDQYYDKDPENRKKGAVGSLKEIIHFYSHSK